MIPPEVKRKIDADYQASLKDKKWRFLLIGLALGFLAGLFVGVIFIEEIVSSSVVK